MQSLTTALENLLRHLSQEIPATPGIRVIDIPFPLKDAFDALSWLASQQTYPQFYWQQRNGDEEAAVLGAITRFTSLDQAQTFLRQHPEHADLRIWGLNAFDPSQGNLLLPRLEWRRCGGKATLRLTLFSESSLQHDAIKAKEFIATLVSIKPLPGLHLTTTREQHWPDKTGWTQLIELATKTIAEGELDKVVLARATDLHFASPVNAAAMMAASRRLNLNCYHFYMAFDGEIAFLGSSPERLWRRRDKALRTEALAGTVANLYPALIEAGLTGEKLILLTADRPPELIDCGANQAIRQPGMFASHPTHSISLPRPTQDIPARWLVSTIDHALGTLHAGGVHINCPFAEPLYGEMDDTGLSWQQRLGDWWQDDKPWLREAPRLESEKQRDWFFWRQKRGVVVAGRMSAEEGKKVALWAQTLGWPLIGDVLSQTGQPLPCADLWLGNAKATSELQQAQIVVQLGSSLTGKRILQWQASCEPEEYWIVDDIEGRLDPAHHRGRRLIANIADWLEQHPAEKRQPWCVEIPRLAEQAMQAVIARRDAFGEAQLAHRISDYLPEQGQLFVGNSLVVRLIDALSQLPAGYPVYSNRGASGIDGLLSTAAGVQRASGKPTLAIVGDLSALYDLNALALLRQVSAPLVLIVVNNNGGQIFSLLPTPKNERERFYLMPQNVHFEHAAAMFELKYHRPQNWQELETALADAWRTPTTTVIEMVVNDTDGAQTLQQLLAQVSHL